MADKKNDGDIIISAKINTDDFEKDAEKLARKAKETGKKLEKQSQQQAKNNKPLITKEEKENIKKLVDNAMARDPAANFTQSLEEAEAEAKKILEDLDKTEIKPKVDVKPATEEVKREVEKATNAATRSAPIKTDDSGYATGIKEAEKETGKLTNQVNTLGDRMEKAFSTGSTRDFRGDITVLERHVTTLQNKLTALGNMKIAAPEFTQIQNQITETQNRLARLKDREAELLNLDVNKKGKQWQKLQTDIEAAKNTIASAKYEEQQMIQQGTAFQSGADTQQYEKLQTQLSATRTRLEGYKSTVSETNTVETKSASIKPALNKGLSTFKKALSNTMKTCSKLGEVIKKTVSAVFSFNRASGKSGKSAARLSKAVLRLGTMLKTMVIRRFLLAIIKGVKEGIDNLAQYSSQVNGDLSTLMSSLTRLKNSLATAFAPILNVITPALNALINKLSDAITYIGMFIARLTGATTFTKAVAVQQDYAESLNNTAEAAKEANKQISDFDELRVMSKDTSANIGTSGVAPGEMFEEVMIPESISKLADKIKEMIRKQDFYGIGVLIGDKINSGLSAINWIEIQNKAARIATGIGQFINGIVDEVDFTLLGKTIAEGINTAVVFAYKLVKTINWSNIGTAIAEAFNGLADNLNWELLGETIGLMIQSAINLAYNFVANFNWGKFGSKVGKSLKKAWEEIEWDKLGSTLAHGITGLATFILKGIQEINWVQIGADLATALNNFIKDTEWDTVGETLGSAIQTMISTAFGMMTTFDWAGFGKSIGELLQTAWDNIDWEMLAQTVSDGLKGCAEAVSNFAEEIDWEKIGNDIWVILSNVDWIGIAKMFFNNACTGFNSIFSLLGGFFGGIFSDAIEEVKKVFNVEEIKKYFRQCLNGITETFGNIGKWFKDKFDNAYAGVKTAFTGAKRFFSDIWEGIKSVFSKVGKFFGDTFSKAWASVQKVFSTGGEIFVNIKDGIVTAFTKIVNSLIDGINSVVAVPLNGINWALRELRNVNIAGFQPFTWLPTIDVPKIPHLATGTVVPPRAGEFMAILGDNNREHEVVSPVSKIEEAVENVLSRRELNGGEYVFIAQLNGKEIFREIVNQNQMYKKRHSGVGAFGG